MKRFTIAEQGYNIEEVNRFIDVVIKRLERLNNENVSLQTKINELEEKLREEKVNDTKISEAILAAQSTSDRIKNLAREEANMIIINDYRNKIKSGEWNFYIVPDKVGFIYMLEKADYSDYKILNSKLIEEYGI